MRAYGDVVSAIDFVIHEFNIGTKYTHSVTFLEFVINRIYDK